MSKYIHIESFPLRELLRHYGGKANRDRAVEKETASLEIFGDKTEYGFKKWHKKRPFLIRFTEEEKEFINMYYLIHSPAMIAEKLNRDIRVIYQYASLNNLRRYRKNV